MRFAFGTIALMVFALLPLASAYSAVIYENEACGHCSGYLAGLKAELARMGIPYEEKYFLGDTAARAEMNGLQERFNVPFTMRGHLLTAIDGKYLFEGHVPVGLISGFMASGAQGREGVVVTQDSMAADVKSYRMLSAHGEVLECPIDTPITACEESAGTPAQSPLSALAGSLAFPVVIVLAGLAGLYVLLKPSKKTDLKV